MPLPSLNAEGDLPPGVHVCSLSELLGRFGTTSARRSVVGVRLQRVMTLLNESDQVGRIIVFGSFVSDKAEPNDVDLFLVMEDTFDLTKLSGEARLIFDHSTAQAHFGASIFWVRRASCFPSELDMVSGWSLKRDGNARGIVDIAKESA